MSYQCLLCESKFREKKIHDNTYKWFMTENNLPNKERSCTDCSYCYNFFNGQIDKLHITPVKNIF